MSEELKLELGQRAGFRPPNLRMENGPWQPLARGAAKGGFPAPGASIGSSIAGLIAALIMFHGGRRTKGDHDIRDIRCIVEEVPDERLQGILPKLGLKAEGTETPVGDLVQPIERRAVQACAETPSLRFTPVGKAFC
jgi:hypothetical protein